MNSPIVIIGGGISGLSTAYFLHQKGLDVRVLESRAEPGGNLLTSHPAGYQIEHGPNSTLHKPGSPDDALGRLMDSLGLTPIEANPLANTRFIVRKGRLVPLPTSPGSFLTTSAFSLAAKLRLLLEPFIGRAPEDEEESIAQFVHRRLGQEFLDYAVDPFVSGVYAGDVHQLSVEAAVAKIFALETNHGSLIRGALQGRQKNLSGQPKGRLISFANGMGALPRAIQRSLPPGTLRMKTRVTRLEPTKQGWRIFWEYKGGHSGTTEARRVVLATPASQAAVILRTLSAEASHLLSSVYYPPILSMALGFADHQVGDPLEGFGFLVPRKEGIRTLGSLFSSTLFPDRAPKRHRLLTSFIGGATDPAVADEDDRALAAEVTDDLAGLLDIEGKPTFVQATRYRESIPQYTLGHLDKLTVIDQALTPFPGLYLRANYRGGISVGDCIRNGELLAEEIGEEEGVAPGG